MNTIAVLLSDLLLKKNIIIAEKKEIYTVGITLILSDIINFTIILLIAIFMKSLLTGLIYLIVFWTVRRFSGGFHAKTYIVCRFVTIGMYVLILLVSKYIIYDYYTIITILCDIFSLITVSLFAPIRHPNKELTEREIKANKFFATLTTLFFTIISLFLCVLSRKEGLVISLVLLAISVLMYIGLLTNGKEEKKNGKIHR